MREDTLGPICFGHTSTQHNSELSEVRNKQTECVGLERRTVVVEAAG